ncbi:MAG: DUF3784 domain-containing protein [Mobilitalea sp.]
MKEDITGLFVSGFIFLLLITIALILRSGRGSFLISGYNMLSKEEKEKYDTRALCRFVGNLLLVISCLLVIAIYAGFYEITWLALVISSTIVVYTIGCLIYANTNNRFKK